MSDKRRPFTTRPHTQPNKSAEKSSFVVRCTTDTSVPLWYTPLHEHGGSQHQDRQGARSATCTVAPQGPEVGGWGAGHVRADVGLPSLCRGRVPLPNVANWAEWTSLELILTVVAARLLRATLGFVRLSAIPGCELLRASWGNHRTNRSSCRCRCASTAHLTPCPCCALVHATLRLKPPFHR